MTRLLPIFSPLLVAFSLSQCSEKKPAFEAHEPSIAAVNYPLAFFAEKIVGDSVDVHFPEIDGDPAFWQPNGADIQQFQNADIILLNGASYAKWLDKVSLPTSRTVSTSVAFEDQWIEESGGAVHQHGDGEAHSHGKLAFTTWLDPQLAKLQLASIHNALVKKCPTKKTQFEAAYKQTRQELLDLDAQTEKAFQNVSDQAIVGSHPVYQYLARRYGLSMKSAHWEPEELPSVTQWQELRDLLAHHPATFMIWEDEPLVEVVQELEKMGIQSLVFKPCANRPEQGDYFTVMRDNLKNLSEIC